MRRLTALVLPIAFVVAAASPAAAATVTPMTRSGPSTRQGAPVSPSGCVQKIHNPHKSKYFGTIAAQLDTMCRNPVPQISQSVQLWEKRWWGWDRVGSKGDKHAYWKRSLSSWANVSCRNSSIKATGNGYVIDVDGTKYTASTASPTVNNPCRL